MPKAKKDILLYNNIDSYSASEFVAAMDENSIDDEILIRICGGGGDPVYGFSMISKIQDHTGQKNIKVTGAAHSMYAFALCYVDDVEALDVSEFLIHRAAYPEWYEENYMTDQDRSSLVNVNKFLQKAFEAKVDKAKFESITGVKVKDIFSLEGRKEVTLTAQDAKAIGLIDRIVKITPQRAAAYKEINKELSSLGMVTPKMAAKIKSLSANNDSPNTDGDDDNDDSKNRSHKPSQTPKKMTIEEFKAAHPEIYKQAVSRGVNKERKRVSALMVFNEVDSKTVKEAIEKGGILDAKMMAEFTLKMNSKKTLDTIEGEGAKDVDTEGEPNTDPKKVAESKQAAAFMASVINLNKR